MPIRVGLILFMFCATPALAQETLHLWSLSIFGGWSSLDDDRHAHDDSLVGFGVGRRLGEHWSLDFEFESYNTTFDRDYLESIGLIGYTGQFRVKQYQISARRFFRDARLRPYVLATAGMERTRASIGSGEDLSLSVGGGLSYEYTEWGSVRVQVAQRFSFNDRIDASASSLQDTNYRLDLVFRIPQ